MGEWYPIQVKQKDKAGRPDIDSFEAVMMREDRKKGFFVAFDFFFFFFFFFFFRGEPLSNRPQSHLLTQASMQKLGLLIVLGGDGTIPEQRQKRALLRARRFISFFFFFFFFSYFSTILFYAYLLPLPGGTMNMLPRALYGDVPWQDVFFFFFFLSAHALPFSGGTMNSFPGSLMATFARRDDLESKTRCDLRLFQSAFSSIEKHFLPLSFYIFNIFIY